MVQSVKYQKSSLFRRICGVLFDAIILISAFFVILSVIVQPIITSATDYEKKYQEYCDELVSTNLYLYYEEINGVSMISSNYDEKLTIFYQNNEIGVTLEDYNKIKYEHSDQYVDENGEKLEEPYFILQEDKTYVENIYDYSVDGEGNQTKIENSKRKAALNKFYIQLVKENISKVEKIERIQVLTRHLSALETLSFLCSLIPAVLVTYLLFPMIFKDGNTLGKKILQMRVVDMTRGGNASKFKLFVRFIFSSLINLVFAYYSFGLTLIVQLIILIFSKNHQMLHDFISKTCVVRNQFSTSDKDIKPKDLVEIKYDDGVIENDETITEENNGHEKWKSSKWKFNLYSKTT